jgi:Protein of unknown function (DUF3182)
VADVAQGNRSDITIDRRQTEHRAVVTYSAPESTDQARHEKLTGVAIAQRLAALKRCEFAGEYDDTRDCGSPVYFVPADTVTAVRAASLGIRSAQDLFGGVVPYRFVATKSISHPLVHAAAHAPRGWSSAFAERVRSAVLPGFSAFTLHDAQRAGMLLLKRGSVRMKPAWGVGGRGQVVLTDPAMLREALEAMNPAQVATQGLVLEQNLDDTVVYSIGEVQVGTLRGAYFGRQRATTDNHGATVYGGSELVMTRGGLPALFHLDLDPNVRLAIDQACAYEVAVSACFPGWFASRRNYDVLLGRDAQGKWRSGVLEQSWRIGGASPAETAALAAFDADASQRIVRAICAEVYGDRPAVPAHATVYFRGVEERRGPLTKYSLVEPYDNAR